MSYIGRLQVKNNDPNDIMSLYPLVRDRRTLNLCICPSLSSSFYYWEQSVKFNLNKSLSFKFKVDSVNYNNNSREMMIMIFIIFDKEEDDITKYEIKVTSPTLKINKCFQDIYDTWCRIYVEQWSGGFMQSFNVEVSWNKVVRVQSGFESLYDDTELVDFQLKAEDGSVHVHKAVLAASSPVLRKMLGGAWREAVEGCLEVPNASIATLQHLKDFIYLDKLPETGLENLMLFVSFYMMTDLEERVTDKIVGTMKAESALDLLDFAFTHKLTGLQIALLRKIQDGNIKVDQIQKHAKVEDQPIQGADDKNICK